MPKLTIELTPVEAKHILQTLLDLKDAGYYYGNRTHFYNRTDDLIEFFNRILEEDK